MPCTNSIIRAIPLSLLVLLLMVCLLVDGPVLAAEEDKVIVVLDGSGSMSDYISLEGLEGQNKMELAVKAVTDTYQQLQSEGFGVEFMVFRGEDGCNIPGIAAAWKSWRRDGTAGVSVEPHGATPTGRALQAAMYQLGYIDATGISTGKGSGQIILISDGLSNCQPPPCKVVKDVETEVIVHTVGFLLADDDEAAEQELRCIAKESGGISVTVTNVAQANRQISRTVLVRNVHNHPRNVPDSPSYFHERYPWWRYPDRDVDGIPDKWEDNGVYFITVSEAGGVGEQWLNLPSFGTDPDRKDLFIYYDWEEGAALDPKVFYYIRQMFLGAPLSGSGAPVRGVEVHFIKGKEIPTEQLPPATETRGDKLLETFRRATEFSGFNTSMWAGSSRVPQLAKYILVRRNDCNEPGCVVGTARGVPGNFAVVYRGDSFLLCSAIFDGCTPEDELAHFRQGQTIVHELGHLLGLLHHGRERCPTEDVLYDSVMSYSYQGSLREEQVVLDYSRDSSVNIDWKMGATGRNPYKDESCGFWTGALAWLVGLEENAPNTGSLTFVLGQFGVDPEFYFRPYGALYFGDGDTVLEKSLANRIRGASPESLLALAEEFDLRVKPEALDPCTSAPAAPFADVTTSSFAFRDIACIYTLGITAGTGPSTFSPKEPVTREQMASFLRRLYWSFNFTPICADLIRDPSPFVDIPETSFAFEDVNCIYGLGVTRGTSGKEYSPNRIVTREHMAAFLSRMHKLLTGIGPTASDLPFQDVQSSFAIEDIKNIFALGITKGTRPSTFSPHDPVTREQMAAFLARLYKVVMETKAR